MPICINCAGTISHLYTVYQSANNLRLEQCPKCLRFADPYVEHDTLTLLLDLILLKRGVFRHILFNRGHEPRRAVEHHETRKGDATNVSACQGKNTQRRLEAGRWTAIFRLGAIFIFIDAFIRWSHLRNPAPLEGSDPFKRIQNDIEPFLRVLIGCAIETVAFHLGVTLTSALVIKTVYAWSSLFPFWSKKPRTRSGVREEFRLSHVPLTLLYSSLTKLFLLLLLTLWRPSATQASARTRGHSSQSSERYNSSTQFALGLLDDDRLDREWVIRNVLGGMAAGFGLRVVLDIKPAFTTLIVLIGWAVKTFVANLLHPWVSNSKSGGDVFLSYSIP